MLKYKQGFGRQKKALVFLLFSRCWILSGEAGHDVQSSAERCERPPELQGGQEEQDYSRYRAGFCSDQMFEQRLMSSPVCDPLPTVSYLNYGPFTSYAPTFDSSFANVSKENSDLIYSFYGEESSLQGSDRYALQDCSFVGFTRNVTKCSWFTYCPQVTRSH